MRSPVRFLTGGTVVTVAAVAVLLLAMPTALAGMNRLTLVFAVQPTTTQVQTAMTPAVVVDVEDSDGNLLTSFDGPVTLAYAVNNIGAPEPENNVVDAVHGVATFPALTFTAVGFGFELQASVQGKDQDSDTTGASSPPSQPFNIVTQLVQCQPGQTCQSQTVSSDGTSGSVVAVTASTSGVLTATGGGFPTLSCTTNGGVLSFTATNRFTVISMTLAASIAKQADKRFFDICWGSPTPFTTKDGSASAFNPANGEYEGLLPFCTLHGPSPCIALQFRTLSKAVTTIIFAPAGDPRGTY